MVDHSEVYPAQEAEFKIVEVFSLDKSQLSGSNSASEVIIDDGSDSDVLVVDQDFMFEVPGLGEPSSDELHSPVQPVKRRRRKMSQEKLYCPICGRVCMSSSGLKVHQKVHSRDTSLDCNICRMTFPSRAAQSAHMNIHNTGKTHQCPCCPLRFASDRALHGHFRVHHKGCAKVPVQKTEEQPRTSPLPPSRSVKRKSKKKHRTERQIPGPQMLSEQPNDWQTTKQKRNKEKIKISKLNRKAFLGATPKDQATFIQQVIEESRRPVAAQKFTPNPERQGPYRCNICNRTFLELHFLERHVAVHVVGPVHKCTMCHASFASARALSAHESEHQNGQYICSVCGKNLHKLGSLLNHQLLHEEKKEQGQSKKQE